MRSSLDQHVRPAALRSRGYAARCVAHRRQANPRFPVTAYVRETRPRVVLCHRRPKAKPARPRRAVGLPVVGS